MKRMLLFYLLIGTARGAAESWMQGIDLAERLQGERRFGEARTLLLEMLADPSRHLDRDDRLAHLLNNLGSVAQDQGRYFEAQNYYHRSIKHWESTGERWHPGLARTLNNLSSLLFSAGKLRESEALLRRAQAIWSAGTRPKDVDALVYVNRAALCLKERRYKEAEEMCERAMSLLTPRDSHIRAQVLLHLGLICEAKNRNEEARSHFAAAQEIWESPLQLGMASTEVLANLALLSLKRSDLIAAKQHCRKALDTAERDLGKNHALVAQILFLYARVLRQANEKSEAAACEKRARAIWDESEERLARHTTALTTVTPGGRR